MDERLADATTNFNSLRKVETPEQKYSAEGLLEDGLKVLAERGKQYDPAGKVERSMEKIVKAFGVVTGKDLTEAEGWMFMAILKAVRSFQRPGFHADSAQDFVCYSALYGEAKAKEGGPQGEILRTPEQREKAMALKGMGYVAEQDEQERRFPKDTRATASYLAACLEKDMLVRAREQAFAAYKEGAVVLGCPHASCWEEMHPKEQQGWLAYVLSPTSQLSSMLPIMDPAKRKKDPATGLDCPTCD